MEHRFSLHGHTRSMSSLASTILSIPSDPLCPTKRPFPRASSVDLQATYDVPLELSMPLPPSRTGTPEEMENEEPKASIDPVGQSLPEWMDHIPQSQDFSLETADYPSEPEGGTVLTPVVPLERIQALVLQEEDYTRRINDLRARLEHLRLSCGLNRRRIPIGAHAYRSLVSNFQAIDQTRFLETYDAAEDAENAPRSVSTPVEPSIISPHATATGLASRSPSWIALLPASQQGTVLRFLQKIRSDHHYIADCLSGISPAELVRLTSTRYSTNAPESVLSGRASVKAHRPNKDPHSNAQSARPYGHGQDDPIFTLLHGVFDVSLGRHSWEYRQRTEVWATACAKIMVGGRRGSDEFLTMALDSFAGLEEWALKPRLESFIQGVLRNGAFLLELPSNHAMDFQESVESRNAKAAVSASNFFENALQDLFSLLVKNLPLSIPSSLLDLVRSVLGKIKDSKVRSRAETFIVSKWFFCSWVSNAVVHPEVHGMLMTQHVGNTARTTILRELAARMQKQIFDVSSPWNFSMVSPDSRSLIEQVFAAFRPPQPVETEKADQPRLPAIMGREHSAFLVLSPQDLIGLIQVLHPQSAATHVSGDVDHHTHSGNASTASSVTDSSTLTSGSTGCGSGVASSMAPSISGTSMTSATVLSEAPFQDSSSTGLDSVELMSTMPSKGARHVQGETEGLFNAHLTETCHTLQAMNEANLAIRPASQFRDWAAIGVATSAGGPEADSSLHRESQDTPEVIDLQMRSGAIGLQEYRDLEDAIAESIKYEEDLSNSLDIQPPRSMIPASGEDWQILFDHLFQSLMSSCQTSFDFRGAHFWWTSLQTLRLLRSNNSSPNVFDSLLATMAERKQSAIEVKCRIVKDHESQLRELERLEKRQTSVLMAMKAQRKALRLRMWYICDVKHSSLYEDALGTTRALKAMTESKRSKRSSGVTSWARQRLRTPLSQEKSSAHILEALAAPKDNGGPAKLADQQIELTGRWLTKNSIENFCKGEERIHRFCHEVQRCANRLAGMDMLESPVLWSSALFRHEKASFDMDPRQPISDSSREGQRGYRSSPWSSGVPQAPPSPISPINPSAPFQGMGLQSPTTRAEFWKPSKPAQATSQLGGNAAWNSFAYGGAAPWSPSAGEGFTSSFPAMLGPPHDAAGIRNRGHNAPNEARKEFIGTVREAVSSLLLSDLGYLLWNQGSETDLWISNSMEASSMDTQSPSKAVLETHDKVVAASGSLDQPQSHEEYVVQSRSGTNDLGISPPQADALSDSTITVRLHEERSFTEKRSRQEATEPKVPLEGGSSRSSFPFSDAYASILERLSSTYNPYAKLDLLMELETLAVQRLDDTRRSAVPHDTLPLYQSSSRGVTVPRTKATSLEEVIANCTERRAGTLRFTTAHSSAPQPQSLSTLFVPPTNDPTSTDEIVETLLSIFRDDNLRPATLYRDLQFIAAHVPSSILDRTAKGKAFWDAGLAALALKEERISAMIARATRITTYHISATKGDGQSFTSSYAPDLVNTTLTDAAHLWTVAAKEGSPVAARELALFYLTHPELVPRVTMPLSKGKDVFRTVGSNEKGVDRGGLDPLTFAVVFHWMEIAASGGDKDARDFLRGTGDLSGGR